MNSSDLSQDAPPSWARWSTVGAGLALSSVFAFHRILDYAPAEGLRGGVEGSEAFFFSQRGEFPGLLLVLAAWLTFRRRGLLYEAISRGSPVWQWGPGAIAAGGAVGLGVWAHYVDVPGLMIPALSLALLGGGAFVGGRAGARALLLPAAFLVLAYPRPGVLLNQIVWPLQLLTVDVATGALALLNLGPEHLGDMIRTDDGRLFQVIEACSGLRSVETLIMSTIIYDEVFDRRGLRGLTLIALSPLVGLLVNQLRVLSIIINPYAELSTVHTSQGIAMLVGGVLAIAAIDWLLGIATLGTRRTSRPRPNPPPRVPREAMLRPIALALVFVMLGIACRVLPSWRPGNDWPPPLHRVAPKLDSWQASGLPLDETFMGSVGFTEWVHRSYAKKDARVEIFLGANDRLDPRVSLISEKTVLLERARMIMNEHDADLRGLGVSARILVLTTAQGPKLVHFIELNVESIPREIARAALSLDRGDGRRPERALVIRASVDLSQDHGAWESHEAELIEVLGLVLADLESLGITSVR